MSRLSDELALSEDPVAQFTDTLIEIANKTFSKSLVCKKINFPMCSGLMTLANKILKNATKLSESFFKIVLLKKCPCLQAT